MTERTASGSMPNINIIPVYESSSSKESSTSQDDEDVADKDLKKENVKKSSGEEDSLAEEVEKITGKDTSRSNLSPTSLVATKEEITAPRSEREKTESIFSIREKPASSSGECQNCHLLRSKLLTLSTKVREFEAMHRRSPAARRMGSLYGKGEGIKQEKNSSAAQTDSDDIQINEWRARCVELSEKIEALQQGTVKRISAFELSAEESMNERDVLLAKLAKAQEKVSSLEEVLVKQSEKNLKLSNIIENLQLKTKDQLEKQKQELIRSAEADLTVTEQLYRSSQVKVVQLETMLKKAQSDNLELRRRLDLANDDLKNVKFGAAEQVEFDRRLEKRLNSLMEKFRIEAQSSDLIWMGEENIRYVMDGFEAAIRTILDDDPHLGPMAERLMVFMDAKSKGMNQLTERTENSAGKVNQESKIFLDLKREMTTEIQLILESFHAKQTQDLAENVCKIMSCLENAEQKVDSNVVKRIDDLNDLLLVLSSKQNDLQTIETRMNDKLESLSQTIDEFSNKINLSDENRFSQLQEICFERYNLRAATYYIEHLGAEHLKLENKLKNVEVQYERLKKEMHNEPQPECPMAYVREPSRSKAEESDMMEWPPSGKYFGSSPFRQLGGQRKESHGFGATRETTKGESKMTVLERKMKSPQRPSSAGKFPKCHPS
uniref:Uncharacterized protein n=1 Tax=Setaria digitata TaxID=48799 RepID=A0A915Q6Y8_9BILA